MVLWFRPGYLQYGSLTFIHCHTSCVCKFYTQCCYTDGQETFWRAQILGDRSYRQVMEMRKHISYWARNESAFTHAVLQGTTLFNTWNFSGPRSYTCFFITMLLIVGKKTARRPFEGRNVDKNVHSMPMQLHNKIHLKI